MDADDLKYSTKVKSSQVTFIYITPLTIQIVSKQLHNISIGDRMEKKPSEKPGSVGGQFPSGQTNQ